MSPLEIPGKPLGGLPDPGRKGICPNCFRSYRTLKTKPGPDKKKTYLHCPFCGHLIRVEPK